MIVVLILLNTWDSVIQLSNNIQIQNTFCSTAHNKHRANRETCVINIHKLQQTSIQDLFEVLNSNPSTKHTNPYPSRSKERVNSNLRRHVRHVRSIFKTEDRPNPAKNPDTTAKPGRCRYSFELRHFGTVGVLAPFSKSGTCVHDRPPFGASRDWNWKCIAQHFIVWWSGWWLCGDEGWVFWWWGGFGWFVWGVDEGIFDGVWCWFCFLVDFFSTDWSIDVKYLISLNVIFILYFEKFRLKKFEFKLDWILYELIRFL